MNAYVLKRVLAFALVFLGLELAVSLAWWAFHGRDRRVVAELSTGIEQAYEGIREAREWLARRRARGDSLDAVSERLARGADAFASRAAYDSVRALHGRRIRSWNEAFDEHERRNARLDSLSTAHDRLVEEWTAAYRRAYPGWLLLPRPDPPRHGAGRASSNG